MPTRTPLPHPTESPEWLTQLRLQGRTVTWLAEQVRVSRTYLHDVAAGRKQASTEVLEAIRVALEAPDRLIAIRAYAADRARWQRVERQARELADSIAELLRS